MISNSIKTYIKDNIGECHNDIETAYSIYILLGKVLYYSPLYAKYKLDNLIPQIDRIRIDNPYVNCNTWAILYNELLKEYNINSNIKGNNNHKYVEINTNNSIIRCDSTLYLKDHLLGYTSDLTNIKYGLDILFFNLMNNTNREEFNNSIKRVHKKYNINENLESSILNQININDLDYSISILNDLYKKFDGLVERKQLFEKYYDLIFSNIDNTLLEYYDSSIISKHIILLEDNNYIETNNGIKQISYKEILNLLNTNSIKLKYKHEYTKKIVKKHQK